MKYSKEQLIQMVAPYFKNDKVNLLYVTEDNQIFYPSGKTQAFSHSRVYKLRAPFEITKEDLKPKKETKEDVVIMDPEKETLLEMAKEMGIKADKRMSVKKIESLIKDKEDARE